MLSVNRYTKAYIDDCRSRVAAQVSAYKALVEAARGRGSKSEKQVDSAIEAFEPQFFNCMVLALDSYFVHRTRALELKDGNPLNEVRMLCNSIMNNAGILCADKTIKYDPAKSVLKYRIGDRIQLTEPAFSLLSTAFLADLESKYT